jgi:hypothetical protein
LVLATTTVGCTTPASAWSTATVIAGTSVPARAPVNVTVNVNVAGPPAPTTVTFPTPTVGSASRAVRMLVAVFAALAGSKTIGAVTAPANPTRNAPPSGVLFTVSVCTSFSPRTAFEPVSTSVPAPPFTIAPPAVLVTFAEMKRSSRAAESFTVNVRAVFPSARFPAIVTGAPAALTVTVPPTASVPVPVSIDPPVMFTPAAAVMVLVLVRELTTLPSNTLSWLNWSVMPLKSIRPDRKTLTLVPVMIWSVPAVSAYTTCAAAGPPSLLPTNTWLLSVFAPVMFSRRVPALT